MRRLRLCLMLLMGSTSACRPRTPTYHQDIAPLLERHCAECHRPGGVAARPLFSDYASAKAYADSIRVAVESRSMPPWGADDTGLCGHWQHARWLSTDEIAAVVAWQKGGLPEGPPQTEHPRPSQPAPFSAAVTVATPDYQPGLGSGGYRCFVTDPHLDHDRLLSAISVESDDARAVAQVTLFALGSDAADAQAAALDGPTGYACYGTAKIADARLVASWTWPTPVLRLPPHTGVPLGKGHKLIVQVHYDIALPGGDFHSATRVGLEFDDGAQPLRVVPLAADATLPAGQRYVAVDARAPAPVGHLVAVAPRMHIRGQTMLLEVEHAGRSHCLAELDHWHFADEPLFEPVTPPTLADGDELHLSCSYSTIGRRAPVHFGDGIDDEECVAYLMIGD